MLVKSARFSECEYGRLVDSKDSGRIVDIEIDECGQAQIRLGSRGEINPNVSVAEERRGNLRVGFHPAAGVVRGENKPMLAPLHGCDDLRLFLAAQIVFCGLSYNIVEPLMHTDALFVPGEFGQAFRLRSDTFQLS